MNGLNTKLVSRRMYISFIRGADGLPIPGVLTILDALRTHGFEMHAPLLHHDHMTVWATWRPVLPQLSKRYPPVVSPNRKAALVALAAALGQDATLLEFGTAEMVAA